MTIQKDVRPIKTKLIVRDLKLAIALLRNARQMAQDDWEIDRNRDFAMEMLELSGRVMGLLDRVNDAEFRLRTEWG